MPLCFDRGKAYSRGFGVSASESGRSSRLIAVAIIVAAVLGIGISIALFKLSRAANEAADRAHLETHAVSLAHAVRQAVSARVLLLDHLRAHIDGAPDAVPREEFATYVAEYSHLIPSLRAVGWSPRIAERGAARQPLSLVEPVSGNERLQGLDLAAVPELGRGIELARDRGRPAILAPVRLPGDDDARVTLVMVLPAFAGGGVPDDLPRRRELFRGALVGVFLAEDLLRRTLSDLPWGLFSGAVTVAMADGTEAVLFASEGAAPRPGVSVAHPVGLGDPAWRLVLSPSASPGALQQRALEWGALLGGLLLTLLLLSFLAVTLGRARKIEALVHAVGTANEVLRSEVQARTTAEEAVRRLNVRLLDQIRDREQAEAALRASEDMFRQALAPTGVVVFAQDAELRYTWIFNSRVEGDDPIGKTDAERMGPNDAEVLRTLKRKVLADGAGRREIVRLELLGGSYYDLSLQALRDPNGTVNGVIGTAIEITELIQARAEAERANAAKSRFLAAASHDLRQPMVGLRLFLELLAETRMNDEQRGYLDRATGSLAATENLLNALMDVSALESGKIRPQFRAVSLATLADSVAEACQAEALEKNVALRTRHCLRHGCEGTVRTDPVLLERILRNLVVNAIRYAPGGQVLVACRCRGGAAMVEVWDTGVGIPEDKIERIFEDFYQIQHSRVGGGVGLGLGLSTVARMAKLLGYRIEVRSRVGRGSMFRIIIPTAPMVVSVGPDLQTSGAAGNLSGAVVAVVEDDPGQLRPLVTSIEKWGCRVVAGDSGDAVEAALAAAGLLPDLLVSDYWLRDETGLEVVARLERLAERRVPTVVLTGDTDSDVVATVRKAGHRLLRKPYARAALREAMSEVLSEVSSESRVATAAP